MASYSLLKSSSFGLENWCLKLQPSYEHGLLTGLSNGEIRLLDWDTGKPSQKVKASETAINDLKVIESDFVAGHLVSSASIDMVKVFDMRTNDCIAKLHNETNSPFISLDSRHGLLACGTELQGIDAAVHIYDIRKWDTPLRSLMDSHHDDVTCVKFHPSDVNVLLSGSTDGYTNIYDLRQDEEEDALHQVINYASIHSCGWLSPKRIYTLSHMETFAIHELNDKSDVLKEPQPADFGDIRETWNCDYVVDIYPGLIATGKTEQGAAELRISPFKDEKVDIDNGIVIPHAHGDEVVRDIFIPAQHSDILYSCGEDGCVKTWKNKQGPLNTPEGFWNYSQKMNVLVDDDKQTTISPEEPSIIQKESVTTKPKKEKHKKSKKHSTKSRFKPY
ncbi:YNL035C [Saccharomyces arboricola H-6]|uniref:YNL035C n=1 Tax=Saccharomyces arboricola (strain H-6 / AS 2.3317 / CBS 10644) TaxID=1160507 RepID=J8PGI7_SACAR|nr:YNL035C [Saccharomyces arboricola H-6]